MLLSQEREAEQALPERSSAKAPVPVHEIETWS